MSDFSYEKELQNPETTFSESIKQSLYHLKDDQWLHDFYKMNLNLLKATAKEEPIPKTPEIELPRIKAVFVYDKPEEKVLKKRLIIPQKLDQPIYIFSEQLQNKMKRGQKHYFCYGSQEDNILLNQLYEYNDTDLNLTFGVEGLIHFMSVLNMYSREEEYNVLQANLASELAREEIAISCNIKEALIDRFVPSIKLSKAMNALNLMSAIRMKMIMEYSFDLKHDDVKPGVHRTTFNKDVYASCRINSTNTYFVKCCFNGLEFEFMVNSKYFCLKYQNQQVTGYTELMNYWVTLVETQFNMLLICSLTEFNDMHDYLYNVLELAYDTDISYPDKVKLISSLESINLYMMDLISNKPCSHMCLIDSLTIWSDVFNIQIYDIWHSLLKMTTTGNNFVDKFIKGLHKIKVGNLGSASSVHKFYSISEIDYQSGWNKYHNRTADRFSTNESDMKQLIQLAKKEFTMGYTKRTGELPKFKEINDEVRLLQTLYLARGNSAFEFFTDLSKWDFITPFDCLSNCQYEDVTPSLKDTACTVEKYNPLSRSSIKELIAYLKRDDSKVTDIKDTFEFIKSNTLSSGRQHLVTNEKPKLLEFIEKVKSDHTNSVVRLVGKEKEQKPEGRYFGIASFDLKIGLSRLMELVKRAVKYYRDQIMTMSDSERKEIMYESAQKMRDPDVYSIMIDISGHNQSMRKENCSDLLEFIMGLYGIEGSGVISELFEHIVVVQEHQQDHTAYISIGQSGAIEGWMNQLWGLQSALIMRLFCHRKSLNTEAIMTYSDDIDLIVRIKDANFGGMLTVFLEAQQFYMKFGQLVKIKQTQLSPTRITMLKNHYINGVSSHTVIKRLLTSTMFSSKLYYCEQLESESISATITSALESCIQIYSCLVFKHLYLLMSSSNTYVKRTVDMIKSKNETLLRELIDPRMIRYLNQKWTYDGVSYTIEDFCSGESYIIRFDDLEYKVYVNKLLPDPVRIEHNGKMFSKANNPEFYSELEQKILMTRFKKESDVDIYKWFIKYTLTSKHMKLLWLLRIYTPINIGGLGVMPLLQSAISGHSDSKSKNVLYLEKLTDYYQNPNLKDWIYSNYHCGDEKNRESLVSNLFPLYRTMQTYKDIIKQNIIKYLTENQHDYSNKDIKNYVEFYKSRSEVYNDLIRLMSKKFYFRIARKYVDVSHINLIETFIQKLEHSQTVLTYINKEKDMRFLIRRIFSTATDAYSYFFYRKIYKFNYSVIPEQNLISIKRNNYPELTFEDILEPTYDGMLLEQYPNDYITVHYGPMTVLKDGREVYNSASTSGRVKPKYQQKYEMDFHFKTPAEYRIFEAVRYTKWAISASVIYGQGQPQIGQTYNLINICNYILHYYTNERYHNLSKFVMTPSGGELFHRTDNQGFKSSSNVRIYPNESGSIYISISPSFVAWTHGEDSNINYDYFRNRLILIALLRSHYFNGRNDFGFTIQEDIKNSSADVRISVIYSQKMLDFQPREKDWIPIVGLEDRLQESFELVSEFLSKGVDVTDLDFSLSRLMDKIPGISKLDRSIFTVMKNIERYMNQTYSFEIHQIPEDIWIGLLDTIDPLLFEQKYNASLSIRKLKNIISTMFDKESEKIYAYKGNKQKVVRDWLNSRYSTELSKLDTISQNKRLMDLLHRNNTVFRETIKLLLINDYLCYSIEQDLDSNLVIKVNLEITRNSFIRALELIRKNVSLKISRNRSLCLFVRIFNDRLIDANIDNAILALKNESVRWKFKAKKIDMEAMIDIPRITLNLTRQVAPINLPSECLKVDPHELQFMDKIHNVIKWYENVVKNHASLIAYDSLTGSQSYHPQYSLFKTLIHEGLISSNNTILDACAGRGDGHLAMLDLKLNHLSVSRGDEYDLFNCAENIHYDTKINIYDTRTLMNYLTFDHFHFDITFIKAKESNNIWDVICWLLKNKKTITIRANWIDDKPDSEHLNILRSHDIRTILGQTSRETFYQIYLYFGRTSKIYEFDKGSNYSFESSKIVENLVNKSLALKKYSIFNVDSTKPINTELSFICSKDMLDHKFNELIRDDGLAGSINEFTGILGSIMYLLENYKDLLTNCDEISNPEINKSFDSTEYGQFILSDKSIRKSSKPERWKTMAFALKDIFKANIIERTDSIAKVIFKMKELASCITAEVFKVPDNFNDIQYMIGVILCCLFNQPSTALRSAYSIIRRHYGRGKQANKKMAISLFQFRCIANNLLQYEFPKINWGQDLKVFVGSIDREEIIDENEDPSNPEFFIGEEMIESLMKMFNVGVKVSRTDANYENTFDLNRYSASSGSSTNMLTALAAGIEVNFDENMTFEEMIAEDLEDANYEYVEDYDYGDIAE